MFLKKTSKEGQKLRWPVWVVIGIGAVVFALPISEKIKFVLVVPLYAMFLITYYKFMYKKRSS